MISGREEYEEGGCRLSRRFSSTGRPSSSSCTSTTHLHATAAAMESPGASGRRRGAPKLNAEDQALDQIAKEVRTWRL